MTEEVQRDLATQGPLDRLAALLDHDTAPWAEGEVPPLGHWLYTLPDARQSMLGPDGHPAVGSGLIPAVAQPRRMWAGSRVNYPGTICIGDVIERRSTVANVVDKGTMTFVTVQHKISANGKPAVVEEQDLVYLPERRAADSGPGKPVDVPDATCTRRMIADSPLLLRFSALTFNAHRIHYDRDYARNTELYPGLVVHGPLLATLLVDHALRSRPGARVTHFSFRARAPVIDGEAFDLCAANDALWVRTGNGVALTASIGFA